MKAYSSSIVPILVGLAMFHSAQAQEGPFPPEDWPPTAKSDVKVHFGNLDPTVSFPGLSNTWVDSLNVLSGGDQNTVPTPIGGFEGLKAIGNYVNIADALFEEWAEDEFIDILIQFYGDSAILNAQIPGDPRVFDFLTGTLPGGDGGNLNGVAGGSLPPDSKNSRWNWALFRIPNGVRPDGGRFVGPVAANAEGSTAFGGVNGGTIRIQNVPGLIVRIVAFGEEGAFGEPEQINHFLEPEPCDPEPDTNHVWVDIANDTAEHLVLLDEGFWQVTYEDNVGPEGDKRRAVTANGDEMNFAITENYLGLPCNDPVTMKICIEYYDDPDLAGAEFGPYLFATDDLGGMSEYPVENVHVSMGTGEWARATFIVSGISLAGVDTAPLTGGPSLIFDTSPHVAISRVDFGIFRKGDHPLAGLDPLPDCYEDPLVCTDAYQNYAEMNLADGTFNGITVGTSAGDQNMVEAEAGPDTDRRMAVRPAFDDGSAGATHNYLNFEITDEVFGPSSQPNAHLAICVTYYDDPSLTGATFRPQVYRTDNEGQLSFGFTPPSIETTLSGSGEWRDAYFEIPNIKFNGVNQGPQAAARFQLSDKVFFTRVQYAIIRPCGPFEGVNELEECKPPLIPVMAIGVVDANMIQLAWPAEAADFQLQSTTELLPADWSVVTETVDVAGDQAVVQVPVTAQSSYYRLVAP
jgi:hypothetical protein